MENTFLDTAEQSSNAFMDPVQALDRPFVLPEGEDNFQHFQQEQGQWTQPLAGQEALLTLESAVTDTDEQIRMNFQVGNLELVCLQNDSREIVELPQVERLPNTAPWFKGIANVRGSMTPIVDLGEAMGNRDPDKKYEYLMLFGRGDDAMGILIDGMPSNVYLNQGNKLDSAPPLPDLLHSSVKGAYDLDGRIRIDLYLPNLFKALSERLRYR